VIEKYSVIALSKPELSIECSICSVLVGPPAWDLVSSMNYAAEIKQTICWAFKNPGIFYSIQWNSFNPWARFEISCKI